VSKIWGSGQLIDRRCDGGRSVPNAANKRGEDIKPALNFGVTLGPFGSVQQPREPCRRWVKGNKEMQHLFYYPLALFFCHRPPRTEFDTHPV
jgi:hypothetical protein